MANNTSLKDKVAERINETTAIQKKFLCDPAVKEAMRLADLFEDIKPSEYILPLDAMAGFPVQTKIIVTK